MRYIYTHTDTHKYPLPKVTILILGFLLIVVQRNLIHQENLDLSRKVQRIHQENVELYKKVTNHVLQKLHFLWSKSFEVIWLRLSGLYGKHKRVYTP